MDAPRPQQKMEGGTVAADLELAFHRILSRHRFSGRGRIHVSASEGVDEPYYVVVIDLDAARVVAQFLDNPWYLRINSDPVIWTIGPDAAKAIVAAAR